MGKLRGLRILALSCFALLAVTVSAAAQSEKERARTHFNRALELLKDNHYELALSELQSAYELHPHYAVLYNLGLTYAALDKPVEASLHLSRFLEEGGANIAPDRRAEAERTLTTALGRIARLTLVVEPAGATISVDSKAVGTAPLARPLHLTAGSHVISVSHEGHESERRTLKLEPGSQRSERFVLKQRELRLELTPLEVECAIVDATLVVDGEKLAKTPVRTVMVTVGARQVRFERAGYTPSRHSVLATLGSTTLVRCALEPLDPLPDPHAGTLALRVSVAGSEARIDGRPVGARARLPIGRHQLEVLASGYRTLRREVSVARNKTLELQVDLEPTSETLRARQTQRTWAYALGAHGVALLGTAGLFYIWNSGRYQDWRERQEALDARWQRPGPYDNGLVRNQAHNDELIESIHRFDRITIGLAVAGTGLLGTGIVLYVTGESPEIRSRPELALDPGGGRAGWSFVW